MSTQDSEVMDESSQSKGKYGASSITVLEGLQAFVKDLGCILVTLIKMVFITSFMKS